MSDGLLCCVVNLQLLQQATSSSNLGAFSGIQQMAGKLKTISFCSSYVLYSEAIEFCTSNNHIVGAGGSVLCIKCGRCIGRGQLAVQHQ